MTAERIRLKDVVVKRAGFTLSIPSWEVGPGEVVGLVGPNGAGKSTLLRLLPGIEAPDAGEVRVFGRDPVRCPVEVRQRLGFMTDDVPLPPLPTWLLFWWLSGFYPTWDRALEAALVQRFGVDRWKGSLALSKGQGTRLRLVTALAFRPDVVVLDEPATGLDPSGRRALLKTVVEVAKEEGRSVIVASHDLADVERIADRLVVLHEGTILKDGPMDALIEPGRTLEEQLLVWGVLR